MPEIDYVISPTPTRAAGRKLILTVHPDPDAECPCDWDGSWKVISFNPRHINYADPADYLRRTADGRTVPTRAYASKFRAGLAFVLDYYEHGTGAFSISGTGPQCQWDTSRYAGVLVWDHPAHEMGPKTYVDRRRDASRFLDTYNAWANGEVYGFNLDTPDRDSVDGCWGFYSDAELSLAVADFLKPGDRVRLGNDYAENMFCPSALPADVQLVK